MEKDYQITEEDVITNAGKRPWGMYRVLLETPYTKVKEIVINPMQRFSLQYHNHRSEVWTVVQGNGLVQLGSESEEIFTEDVIEIIEGEHHRMTAGEQGITFIEVQLSPTGNFEENDIVRLEDDYGR